MDALKKNILLFARDPGGANIISLMYLGLDKTKYNVMIFGKEFSLIHYKKYNISAKNIEKYCDSRDKNSLEKFLLEQNPDLVITGTSADDFTEKYLWEVAKKHEVKCIAILDQWINYGLRFSKYSVNELEKYLEDKNHVYLPDKIWVMDEYALNQIVLEGVDASLVEITGQPYFDYMIDLSKTLKYENIIKEEGFNILFISEPIQETYCKDNNTSYMGYTEFSIFEFLCIALVKIQNEFNLKINLNIRLHPKDNANKYDDLIQRYQREQELNFSLDFEKDNILSILKNDLIIGMSSIFLLESKLLNRPILSIQIGLKCQNPFVLENIGVQKSIYNQEDLYEALVKQLIRGDDGEIWNIKKNSLSLMLRKVDGICQNSQ